MSRLRSKPTGAITSLEDPPALIPSALRFRDRRDAGRRLAALLEPLRDEHPIVVGIPRGGVPVAAEVARTLDAPLDVVVVSKLGAPQNPEFAIGALSEGGVHVLSRTIAGRLGLSGTELEALIEHGEAELGERLHRYRGDSEPVELAGRTVVLVDDGLATGSSALAAVGSLRRRGAARVILAVPVAAPASVDLLRDHGVEVVSVEMPEDLWAVGYWYEDFSPATDDEVMALLGRPHLIQGTAPGADQLVHPAAISADPDTLLSGELTVPPMARGVVAFAHGSGSSRLSPRNREVARALCRAGFATLLFDLLTPEEESDRANVFDVPLLASRLLVASAWLRQRGDLEALPLGYFGASTGAAAALTAAAELGEAVSAVVSRGGRPDLAHDLSRVRAPTLLIVGGADEQVLALNRSALARLGCPSELAVVPGATHLFEEPGALEQVSRLAIGWLEHHLATGPTANEHQHTEGGPR
jgi:putative phosphoribosyl transferase